MPRKPRILTDSGIYHLISRGNNRQVLFRESADFQAYLDFIGLVKKEYTFHLYHYCLMSNHVHLLARFFDQEGLQKVMQRINLNYAKLYRRKYRYCGHVFQDRFKSFPIEADSYVLECGRYIERNPLKAGIVKELGKYAWSSYRYYAEGKPSELVTANPLYESLGRTEEERRMKYQEYLLLQRPYEKLIEEGLMKG